MQADTGFVEAPGARLYYEAEGDGHPLVLVHAGVAHLGMWDEQVAAWSERYRVIRYDTRGFGRTESEDVEFSNRSDLAAVLDHLGVESAYVLGLSRGGSIALDFTLEFPDRVDALVLVAAGVGGFDVPLPHELTELFEELERLYEAKAWDRLVAEEVRLWGDGWGQSEGRMPEPARSRLTEMNHVNYRTPQPEGKPVVLRPPAAGRLGEVRVPTLVVWGELDEPGVLGAGEHLTSGIAGARKVVFRGVAHMVNMERPDEFNGLVLDFLAGCDASKARPTS